MFSADGRASEDACRYAPECQLISTAFFMHIPNPLIGLVAESIYLIRGKTPNRHLNGRKERSKQLDSLTDALRGHK